MLDMGSLILHHFRFLVLIQLLEMVFAERRGQNVGEHLEPFSSSIAPATFGQL